MNLDLYFFGTSASYPTLTRNVSSVGIKFGSELVLFDCGEGSQRQIMGAEGVTFMQLNRVFISHFHGDHYLGLLGMLQTMHMNDRKKDIDVYGPKGTVRFMKGFMASGYVGIGFPVKVHELDQGMELDMKKYKIIPFGLKHHDIPTLGYVFQEAERPGKFDKLRALELGIPEGPMFGKLQRGESIEVKDRIITPDMVLGPTRPGRKVVYALDTVPTENVVKYARDADVLIHDSTGSYDIQEKMQRYGHTTAGEAADIAKKAGVEKLILTHISPRYEKDSKKLLEEARATFPNTKIARDMMVYSVELRL